MLMAHLYDYAVWVAAIGAGLGAAAVLYRAAAKRVGATLRRLNEVFDTLLGRDAIPHPDTGAVLVPATPGLGRRLADMEATIARLADNEDRISRLETKFDGHVEHSRHMEELRAEEATEMWKAIRAVAETTPSPFEQPPTDHQESQP